MYSPVPSFPDSPGPLNVGTAEYEIPISELPSAFAANAPDTEISTIKFRTFYPTQKDEQLDQSVTWLPDPQREWLQAYCSFLGAPPYISKLLSYSPLPFKYTTIPAGCDARLPDSTDNPQLPVLVFSHGLGGSCNAYSHLLRSLASCGVFCVAIEHRDQSAPFSIIRQTDGTSKRMGYMQLSHNPNPEVLRGRNQQLRIRIWEVEGVYTALVKLNDGTEMTDLAARRPPSLTARLDLKPSKVSWAGHSFGSATMVQFVKSVFWHQALPGPDGHSPDELASEALYTPADHLALKQQITTRSPVILLDLWTMPLRGDTTRWLFEKPLPCFAGDKRSNGNVLAVMSEEFYKLNDLMTRVKAVLSENPADPEAAETELPPPTNRPHLFYTPKSAHLSQSDFGVLFPWTTNKVLRAEDPAGTLVLNTRAILQLLRECGISVESVKDKDKSMMDEATLDDPSILAKHDNIQGWTHIPINSHL